MTALRVLIVDDEPWARRRLAALLAEEDDVEVVGLCADGDSAVDAIRRMAPDLVLLDVQMPGLDGFGVLAEIGVERCPAVVFATAYDEYAVRAFDANAVDYLLKPFDAERFRTAIARARERVAHGRAPDAGALAALLATRGGRAGSLERVAVTIGSRTLLIEAGQIDWIEADGNYARLHVGPRAHLLRETLTSLEAKLDPRRFLRVHRSSIVNLDRVRETESWGHGELVVVLADGTRIAAGRRYRDGLRRLLENVP